MLTNDKIKNIEANLFRHASIYLIEEINLNFYTINLLVSDYQYLAHEV
jgi:hypothetical protein